MNKIHHIKPEKLLQLLQKKEVTLIDVREPIEYHTGYIEHAHNIPLSSINKIKVKSLTNKDKKIVVYCKSGSRSLEAAKILIKNSEHDVWNLEGGITSWINNSLPIKRNTSLLTLERQTHIALGTLILIGSLLTFFISPKYLVIPVIIGLGLLNSGITGWCGLGKLIAKMPWNNCSNKQR